MQFHRERGIRRETPKLDAQALEPTAICKAGYEGTKRIFYVYVGARTLGSGISPTVAWQRALRKMLSERAIDHVNSNPCDNRLVNLRVVKISENLKSL